MIAVLFLFGLGFVAYEVSKHHRDEARSQALAIRQAQLRRFVVRFQPVGGEDIPVGEATNDADEAGRTYLAALTTFRGQGATGRVYLLDTSIPKTLREDQVP